VEEDRVGLEEVLAALDEVAKEQRAYGDQLAELEYAPSTAASDRSTS